VLSFLGGSDDIGDRRRSNTRSNSDDETHFTLALPSAVVAQAPESPHDGTASSLDEADADVPAQSEDAQSEPAPSEPVQDPRRRRARAVTQDSTEEPVMDLSDMEAEVLGRGGESEVAKATDTVPASTFDADDEADAVEALLRGDGALAL